MKLLQSLIIVLLATGSLIAENATPQEVLTISSKGSLCWLVTAYGTPACGGFREITKQADGKYLASLGSLTYILGTDGRQISQGYMKITKQDGGGFLATIGSMTYFLNAMGRQVSEGYMELTKKPSGYSAQNGTKQYSLDNEGQIISTAP